MTSTRLVSIALLLSAQMATFSALAKEDRHVVLTEEMGFGEWHQMRPVEESNSPTLLKEPLQYMLFEEGTFYAFRSQKCGGLDGEAREVVLDIAGRWALTPQGITLRYQSQRVAASITCTCQGEPDAKICSSEVKGIAHDEREKEVKAEFMEVMRLSEGDAPPEFVHMDTESFTLEGQLYSRSRQRMRGGWEINAFLDKWQMSVPQAHHKVLNCAFIPDSMTMSGDQRVACQAPPK